MTVRSKGLADQQTLVWDAENRLSQVQDDQGNLLDRYWYGVKGTRVKKLAAIPPPILSSPTTRRRSLEAAPPQ